MTARSDRRQAQRGAQVVELGLTILPLLAIMFLLIDLCLVIFLKATFQSAVREGVRYAITGQTETGLGHDASIRSVVRYHALNFIPEADAASRIRIRYFRPDTLVETTSNAGGNIVEISIQGFPWRPFAGLWKSGDAVTIAARSSDLMEPCPPAGCPAR
ncbi:MAG: pilus assembly protein [Acidobacteria bacterium]|nr:pilus assembly protein [Acidobacteriota bacterium]